MADATLTEEQIAEYKKDFNSFDTNKDGNITLEDLGNTMEKSGTKICDQEWAYLISQLDVNQNGKIDFDEYVTWMEAVKRSQRFVPIFQELDKDGNGFISAEEYLKNYEEWGMTKEMAEKTVKDMDKDGDGKVNYKEFLIDVFKKTVLGQ